MQNLKTYLTQKNSNGRTKFIDLRLNPPFLTRTWGLNGGKAQSTKHTYNTISQGKANELTPEQAAKEDYHRIIAQKCKEGYVVKRSDSHDIQKSSQQSIEELDFKSLPTEFCCSKPHQKLPEAKIDAALKAGNCSFFLKYNGLCHYILITNKGDVKLYTRRMDDHTKKYPAIVEAVKKKKYPPCTVLIAEFTIDPALGLTHMESFKKISEISKVDTLKGKLKESQAESLRRQEKTPVSAVVFGVLYYSGRAVWKEMDYKKMFSFHIIDNLPIAGMDLSELSRPLQLKHIKTVYTAQQNLKNTGDHHEGFVAWMLDEKLEVSFNGKPKRRAAYKVKVKKEIDVTAYGWIEGKGDRQGKIGSLKIGEFTEDGVWRDLGAVGSGISDEDANPSLWEFPCVVEIQYDNRFPTGKFQFPRFVRVHPEKILGDLEVL